MGIEKKNFTEAYATISKIEDLLTEAGQTLDSIPRGIQQAILYYHREPATLQHCLRWGLQAAKELREDWHVVVAGLPCEERS
jgi:hypothetical protein